MVYSSSIECGYYYRDIVSRALLLVVKSLKRYVIYMSKVKYGMVNSNLASKILSEAKSNYGLRTYISLFSSAGIGCYGFKEEGFYCIATVELLERRLKIQTYNHKCIYDSGYICGDMTLQETKDKVFCELTHWKNGIILLILMY